MAYDMKDVKAPRLAGMALQAVAVALENRAAGSLLIPKLLADTGITAFRERNLSEPPTVLPELPRRGSLPDAPAAAPAADAFALAEAAPRPPGHAFESVVDYLRAYQAGTLSPVEVARRVVTALRAGDAQDPRLAAIISWREDDIVEQATASAARWKAGKPLSPLDGVPVAVKDEIDQVGHPTTVGTGYLKTLAVADGAAVARLRAAGALLYGKAAMVEIGIDTLGYNMTTGTPRNPYGQTVRYTGGSSSGSGAAVGLGLGPVAVGADGGGSIRIPSALCGVAGLKATHGRISEQGAYPLCPSVGHIGPIGATVRDVALAYQIMAGPVDDDAVSQTQPPVTLAGLGDGVAGLRLGIYRAWFDHADPAIVRACRAAVERLAAAGATVVDIEIPDLELARMALVVTILAEMSTAMDALRGNLKDHTAAVRINLAIARSLTGRDYVRAQQARTRMGHHFAQAFRACDVIVTPTTATTAPLVRPDVAARGESNLEVVNALMRFVAPLNLTGHPALTVPVGYDDEALPIGLQLIGRPWEEHVLFRVGETVEKSVTRRKPERGYRLLGA